MFSEVNLSWGAWTAETEEMKGQRKPGRCLEGVVPERTESVCE